MGCSLLRYGKYFCVSYYRNKALLGLGFFLNHAHQGLLLRFGPAGKSVSPVIIMTSQYQSSDMIILIELSSRGAFCRHTYS